MAARNEERLLNLTIALLDSTRFMTKEEIYRKVEGYTDVDEPSDATDRKFERDKDDLRAMGVSIRTGPSDVWSDLNDGYRIFPEDYFLPEMTFTAEESRIIALANTIVADPLIEEGVRDALGKLRALGAEPVSAGQPYMVAHVLTGGPHLDILDEAVRTRTAVQFTYHDKLREVQGWKIIQRFGFYYFLGFEQSTGPRIFKLARIQSQAELVGNSGAFDSPAPRDIDELVASLEGPEPTRSVRVALRDFTAGHLRRRGVTVKGEAPLGYELVEIPYARLDEIISSLCEVGPDALVMDPGEVRDGVLAHMRFWQGRI